MTNGTLILHLHNPEASRRYVLVETTFPLYWVKHELSSTDISKYFYKRNNNKKRTIKIKKDYYIELNLFFLCWLACFKFVRNKNVQVFGTGDIISTIHMSKHMRFFLSKLKVF